MKRKTNVIYGLTTATVDCYRCLMELGMPHHVAMSRLKFHYESNKRIAQMEDSK